MVSKAAAVLLTTALHLAGGAGFEFDGLSSDLVQQFKALYERGVELDLLEFEHAELPSSIQTRLESFSTTFDQLPGLLQRAVLWEGGYVTGPSGGKQLVKIYTAENRSMAELAVSVDDYDGVGCTRSNCTDSFDQLSYRSQYCNGAQMASVARCASQDVAGEDQHLSMWATGGNASSVPSPNIVRHDWTDDYSNVSYLMFAIHMVAPAEQPSWNTCELSDKGEYAGSMIVPCSAYSEANASANGWSEPAPSEILTSWLKVTADELSAGTSKSDDDESSFNLLYLIPIIAGVVVVALVGVFARFRWKRHQDRRQAWNNSEDDLDHISSRYFK